MGNVHREIVVANSTQNVTRIISGGMTHVEIEFLRGRNAVL